MGRLLVLALAAFGALGCTLPPRGSTAITLNYNGRRYCRDPGPYGGASTVDYSIPNGTPPAEAFRRIMCHAQNDGRYYTTVYQALDPDRPDPFLVALMIVECVSEGRCRPSDGRTGSVGDTSDVFRFARDLDRNAVQQALERLDAPPEVKATFMDRLAACQGYITQAVFEMSPRLRAIFVETIDRTIYDFRMLRHRTWSHHQAYAALRPEIDQALLTEGFGPDLHARAIAQRDAYVRDCAGNGSRSVALCANGPVARPLTEFIVRSALAQARHAEALAEQELLRQLPDVRDERYAIHVAVAESMRREIQLYRDYTEARRRLADTDPRERDRLLAEQFGPAPPEDMSEWNNVVGIEPPAPPSDIMRRPDAQTRTGRVLRSRRRGREVIVDLESTTYAGSAPFRIALPDDEGAHLAAGHVVEMAVEGESTGRVIRVRRDDARDAETIQLRAFWFGD